MPKNFAWILPVLLYSGLAASARQNPTHPPRQSPLKETTPLAGVQPTGEGRISGYVYWDTSVVQHNPAGACNGLTATVGVGTSPSGTAPTFEQFTSFGTQSNFTYLNDGSNLGVCAYNLTHLPIGKDLQVQIGLTTSAFSQTVLVVTPPTANDPNSPIKIAGGTCNNLPPAVPSPSVLGSRWWTCGDYAFNVNFLLKASGPGGIALKASGPAGTAGGTAGSLPAVQQPGAINQPAQKPLTNNDVLNMVRAGLPQTIIISSIQSSSTKFDLSNPARAAFLRSGGKAGGGNAGSLDNIWNAMTAKSAALGGPGGMAADELNPQPYPPKGTTSTPGRAAQPGKDFVLPKDLKIFTVGEVRNPAALPLLRNAAQLRGGAGGSVGPERTMSATGNSNRTASLAAASPGMLGGPAAMQPGGGANRFDAVPANVASVCLNKTGIGAVNGKTMIAPFTPGGHYVITGCGFGSTPGKVYLTGGFPAHNGKVELGPYYQFGATRGWAGHWSEKEIDAQLDEGLSGELDQYNVNLVVETSTGQLVQLTGLNFNAERAEFMVTQIPSSAFSINVGNGAVDSPCTSAWVTGNCTVDVLRNDMGQDPTPDLYTINLRTGFVFSRAVLLVMSQTKVTDVTAPEINGNQIIVHWHWTRESTGFTYSLYGLQIYVIGPLGVTDAFWDGK